MEAGKGGGFGGHRREGLVMMGLQSRGSVRRWVADFVLAFVLFWAAALGLGAAHSRACAVSLPFLVREVMTPGAAPASPAGPRPNELDRREGPSIHPETRPAHARLLISLAFATLAALNLGFW